MLFQHPKQQWGLILRLGVRGKDQNNITQVQRHLPQTTCQALSLPCLKDWQQFQCRDTQALVHEQGEQTSTFFVKVD